MQDPYRVDHAFGESRPVAMVGAPAVRSQAQSNQKFSERHVQPSPLSPRMQLS
jgi:hypothetical protein